MKNKPLPFVFGIVLLIACLIIIFVMILNNKEVPIFLIGFTGALCGIMINLIKDIFGKH